MFCAWRQRLVENETENHFEMFSKTIFVKFEKICYGPVTLWLFEEDEWSRSVEREFVCFNQIFSNMLVGGSGRLALEEQVNSSSLPIAIFPTCPPPNVSLFEMGFGTSGVAYTQHVWVESTWDTRWDTSSKQPSRRRGLRFANGLMGLAYYRNTTKRLKWLLTDPIPFGTGTDGSCAPYRVVHKWV